MDIKKIFINCMIVLSIGVVILSVVTVVKRNSEPKDEVVVSKDVVENSEPIIDPETMESTEDIVEEETLATKTLYTTSKVNVRTGPGTSYDKVVELQAGIAIVAVGELDENGWQMIEYEGEEAYILGRYLTETVPEVQTQSAGNQTANMQQNVQQPEQSVQSQPAVSEPVWYLPVGNGVEQTTTSQDTTTQQPTTTDTPATSTTPESTPVVPESTPVVPETTPTVPETTPTVPEVTPTTPETTPVVPETTPTVPETTPTTPEVTPTTPEQTPVVPESGV